MWPPSARPVEHDDGRGDLGQAADLDFVVRMALGEDVAGLVIRDDIRLDPGFVRRPDGRRHDGENRKSQKMQPE